MFESCTRRQFKGAWQRGRLRLPVKQSLARTRWSESIRTHQPIPGWLNWRSGGFQSRWFAARTRGPAPTISA